MEILYQDARILVCIKPSGVLSTDEAGGMPALVREYLSDPTACVKTVHRLDAAVSGVMVFARSHKAASILSGQIREKSFQKEYLAVICGQLPQEKGVLEDFLLHDRSSRQTRVCNADDIGAQKAVLSYRVLEQKDGMSLVLITLHTGRTHQIRVQLASRGLSIYGDKKYGAGQDVPIALWSCRISFFHPQTGLRVCFSHPAPDITPWTSFEMRCLP